MKITPLPARQFLTLLVTSAFIVCSAHAKDGKDKPTNPASPQNEKQDNQKDDGQQQQKNDGKQGQKDNGQQHQKDIAVTVEEKPALQMTVPKDTEVTTKGELTTIQTKDLKLRIYLWRVPTAKTVADVMPRVGAVIKSEFLEFVVESTENLQVAGHAAKHLKGKGEEADDNDPGAAEVVVFTDGTNVYAACVHGEKDHAARERPEFLKVLESIKVL